jgi:hypothetical protein
MKMSALATFALFFGIILVFMLGLITGAALTLIGDRRKFDKGVGVSYRPDTPVVTKVRGGGIEEDTKH